MEKIIVWDFDGTLGFREGNWESAVMELARSELKIDLGTDSITPFLQAGFPWHKPSVYYGELTHPDKWWDFVAPVFANIFRNVGCSDSEAVGLSTMIRERYTSITNWNLYSDTRSAIETLGLYGWSQILVTNNIPEFRDILTKLEFADVFEDIVVSAECGYNKPNPEILGGWRAVMEEASRIIVVGDRVDSDIRLAIACAAEGILVRSSESYVGRSYGSLEELVSYLINDQ